MPLWQTPAAAYSVSTAPPAYGLTNKRITFVGDSTAPSVASTAAALLTSYAESGGPLDGCTLDYWGENGASLASYMDGDVTNDFAALQALDPAPDFVVFGYGVNSVRLGAFTQQQFTDALTAAIDQHVAAESLADTVFILKTPATFLTTDVGSAGYVSPNESAQAYSTILQNAYAAQVGRHPNVFLFDMPQRLFGRTSPALSNAMLDQIHPNAVGQTAWVVDLVRNFLTEHIIDAAFP